MKQRTIKLIVFGIGLIVVTYAAFWFAEYLQNNEAMQSAIQSFGIFGAIIIAIIGGLNPLLPVPPATFAPAFVEAGLTVPLIITGFVIGTTIADSIGYGLARIGSAYMTTINPTITTRVNEFLTTRQKWVLPAVWFYTSFMPLPNEFILIPLGLAKYDYKKLLLPVVLGNIFHHSLLVFGYGTLFKLLF